MSTLFVPILGTMLQLTVELVTLFFMIMFFLFLYFVSQNVRPSADDLPEDLALIVTSCWKEDPNARPNFTQIIKMLLHYLSNTALPGPTAIPPQIFTSQNAVFSPESPGTSTLIGRKDESDETPKTPMENSPRGGLFSCFYQCY